MGTIVDRPLQEEILINDTQRPLFGEGEADDSTEDLLLSEEQVFDLARKICTPPPETDNPLPDFIVRARERRAKQAADVSLVAKWSKHFGYITIHDPASGERHDLAMKDAPRWAKEEARRAAALYKSGNRHAYDLTSAQMEEIWEAEHPDVEVGIVEDYPIEEENEQ
jgi:hypothetical protein